ncbi:hypothetical protein VTH82DRAFT_6770 [Thermothelomyces myriococcoides]
MSRSGLVPISADVALPNLYPLSGLQLLSGVLAILAYDTRLEKRARCSGLRTVVCDVANSVLSLIGGTLTDPVTWSKLVEVDDNTPYVLKAFRNYNTRGIAITSPDVRDRMLENLAASGFITRVAPQAENDVGRHSGREVLPVDRNPRFRLIDCNTRKICPVPGTSLEGCERLPNRVPAVINYALTITKNLGVGYLWVDRYCIDQTDEVDKTVQIQQMQAIYWNACFTIIAAAESDPHYGLPGPASP